MSHFDQTDQVSIARFILNNLLRHELFVLGTVDPTGNPWAVCLNLSFDNKINIIWKSQRDTEHSKHIIVNPHISICIFSKTNDRGDFGLYIKGIAREVADEAELIEYLKVRYASKGKPLPDKSKFIGEAIDRIYIGEAAEAWVNDDRHLKVRVDLRVLREEAKKMVTR